MEKYRSTPPLPTSDRVLLLALGVLIATAAISAFYPLTFLAVAAAVLAAALFVLTSDRARLFILGLLFPLQGLRLVIPPVRGSALTSFFPDGIDLSLVNVFALLALIIFASRVALALLRRRTPEIRLPLILPALFFWLTGFISVINAEDGQLLAAKYVLYPIVFSYLAFVVLPVSWIKRREGLRALTGGMLAAGAISAAIGLISLFVAEGAEFKRVTPIAFFGVWPLGANHNLLAETLVATAPLALARALQSKERRLYYLALAAVMAVVSLLTFARTAWIAFMIMAAAALIFEYRAEAKKHWKKLFVFGLLAIPLLVYVVSLSATREVSGSTASRLALTRFAFYMFASHPLIGAGAGTFVPRLGLAKEFTQEFGDPLDAHGFVQKILAEQGALGLAAFLVLLAGVLWTLYRALRALPQDGVERRVLLFYSLAALGMMIYEVFNTTYWSAKMWLPIGLAIAAARIVRKT